MNRLGKFLICVVIAWICAALFVGINAALLVLTAPLIWLSAIFGRFGVHMLGVLPDSVHAVLLLLTYCGASWFCSRFVAMMMSGVVRARWAQVSLVAAAAFLLGVAQVAMMPPTSETLNGLLASWAGVTIAIFQIARHRESANVQTVAPVAIIPMTSTIVSVQI